LTLIELLVAMVIATISGAALIQAMLAQGRAADNNEAWRVARTVSRGSLNRFLADLRAAEADGALDNLTADGRDVTIRVPYAFGIACGNSLPDLTVSILPVDNAVWAAARFGGFAWRGSLGRYRYRTVSTNGASVANGNQAVCDGQAPPIATLPPAAGSGTPGRVVRLNATSGMGGTSGVGTPTVGMPVILYQRVRYRFEASVAIPGRTALWREVLHGGANEELAAPFDSTAHFRFFVTGSDIPQTAVPSPRSLARGLELHLDGMSETIPRGTTTEKRLPVTSAVFFKNRHD
jgi:type II secretory pathway pseudopilin PulG